ncbi:phosphatidylinositol 4-kinase alpha 1-like [Miscanthus floridulus]|uniref:phosphatidylinositol 4-kinase alpha 1-like n=1 Tax=Miscanthus floridulus TaxID=154761 RepID=UPI003458245F
MRRFEEEEVDELERKEVAFRLIVHMLGGKGGLETEQVGKVRNAAARQVQSLTDFLKIRKRDWREQGAQLRARINTKLMCCQAAVVVLARSVSTMDTDSKSSKDMLQ